MLSSDFLTKEFNELIMDICGPYGEPSMPQKAFFNPDDYSHRINTFTCLSVRQPWAELIVKGIKDIENRTWATGYRGLLLIQSTITFDWEAWHFPYVQEGLKKIGVSMPELLKRGAIIGAVEITGINGQNKSMWAERNKWHWHLRNAAKFEKPVIWKGQLSLWKAEDKLGHLKRELFKAYNL